MISARSRHRVVEPLREARGVLARHRVQDQQRLVRRRHALDISQFPHEVVLDDLAARRVDDDDVDVAARGRRLDAAFGDGHRVALARLELLRVDGHADLFGRPCEFRPTRSTDYPRGSRGVAATRLHGTST